MPVRLLPDGTIEFDTVSEAVEYALRNSVKLRFTNENKPRDSDRSNDEGNRSKSADLVSIFRRLSPKAAKLFDALADADTALTTEQLAEKSGLDQAQIGPTMRHVTPALMKAAVRPSTIVKRELVRKSTDGGRVTTTCFTLTPLAKEAWKEANVMSMK